MTSDVANPALTDEQVARLREAMNHHGTYEELAVSLVRPSDLYDALATITALKAEVSDRDARVAVLVDSIETYGDEYAKSSVVWHDRDGMHCSICNQTWDRDSQSGSETHAKDCPVHVAKNLPTAARELLERVEKAERWVSDLQSGMYVNCVYCGHRYGPGETTPVSMADALKQHIEHCPKHPLKEARDIVAECNNSLFGSHGYFTQASGVTAAQAIEKLKAYGGDQWRRATAAESEVARLRERQRTPGTVEVCERHALTDCADYAGKHERPTSCRVFRCPLRTAEREASNGG